MKILLYLNGPINSQTGTEDGFKNLINSGLASEIKWFYLENCTKNEGLEVALSKASSIADKFQPTLVVFFHIGKLPITQRFIEKFRKLPSKPILVYDEGDMYGSWSKPITRSMEIIMSMVDVVSIRGLGSFYDKVFKHNKKIIYTPHHADIARFDKEPYLFSEKKNRLVLIGNKVTSRLGAIRRLPGAAQRECFVRSMGKTFGTEFVLYGNGWEGFVGDRGPVDFFDQLDVYRESWITVAYEHYPEIPYYFSNRLPIALMAGSLYVCHYHKGYENIFKNCDFIFFFNSTSEAVDLVNYIHSLSKDDLAARSQRAREFSLRYFHPSVIWKNFVTNSLSVINFDSDRRTSIME